MSEELLKGYSHAMVIDEDTGKPMMKVSTTGGGDSGGDVKFPDDYPDKNVLSKLNDISTNITSLKESVSSINTTNELIIDLLEGLISGEYTIKVSVEEPETEPVDPEEE